MHDDDGWLRAVRCGSPGYVRLRFMNNNSHPDKSGMRGNRKGRQTKTHTAEAINANIVDTSSGGKVGNQPGSITSRRQFGLGGDFIRAPRGVAQWRGHTLSNYYIEQHV